MNGRPAHAQLKATTGKSGHSEQERRADQSETGESPWGKEFAQPLIDKRKMSIGEATVAELQIYYLQKDASPG